MNKKKLVLILLSVIFSVNFLTYCVFDTAKDEEKVQTQIVSTNTLEVVFYTDSDFSDYETLTNLVHYEVYELKKSHYTLTGGGETISNFKRFSYITNYSTNVLMTNTISSINKTFQTVGNDFIVTNYTNDYQLISDSTIVGYSNYLQETINIITNSISEFTLLNNTFNLNIGNSTPRGITAYNNKFYVLDNNGNAVYTYNNTGIYESFFSLHANNGDSQGIAVYSNKFYITDNTADSVFIYDTMGVYETNFDLRIHNTDPVGIVVYSNKFYITDSVDSKVYIYDSSGIYESEFSTIPGSPAGIAVYSNNFYIADAGVSEIHTYDNTGTYLDGFRITIPSTGRLHGIIAYSNKFYITDQTGSIVDIYSLLLGTTGESIGNNTSPQGITAYNDKFYIVDNANEKVFIYDNTGIYENQFDLDYNRPFGIRGNPIGITIYNNTLYITDSAVDRVFLYGNTGIYEHNFHLIADAGSRDPYGITAYNNNFYVMYKGIYPSKVYLYSKTSLGHQYQSNSDLSSANVDPRGVVAYNNKLYVVDSTLNVYIYNISGTIYQSSFNLHSDNSGPRGIEIYNGSFYITDIIDSKVYIYPIDPIDTPIP